MAKNEKKGAVAKDQATGVTVAKIVVSPEREIHVQKSTYGGRENLDIRTYVKSEKYAGYSPKGFQIPWEVAVAGKGKELAEAIIKIVGTK
jgi:hypothetical protein